MKTAYILFIAAAAWLFVVPVVHSYLGYQTVQREQLDAAIAKIELEPFYNPVIEQSSSDVERSFQVDYKGTYNLRNGFHLIHDNTLGQEAFLKGPAEVLDAVSIGGNEDELMNFNFSRPVKLNKPVIVRLNLNEHHIGNLHLLFDPDPFHPDWPNFSTNGPLKAYRLEISGDLRSEESIPIETTYAWMGVDIVSGENRPVFTGKTKNIDLHRVNAQLDLTALQAAVSKYHFQFPMGRKLAYRGNAKVVLTYERPQAAEESDAPLNIQPDTMTVVAGAEVSTVRYLDGSEIDDDRLVVIIRE